MNAEMVVAERSVIQSAVEWTRERLELVKKTVCPQGISDAEFELFVEQCKRSGLDPLTKEIFCVKRKLNIGTREHPRWIEKHEAQPAEAGLLARADRFGDFRGIKAAAVYSGDEISIDQDTVVHRFNPASKGRGQLVGAWAQAFREGRVLPVEYLTFEAYRQTTGQWGTKPDTMLTKCARAAALRRAYPNAFKGLYLREEMPAEELEHVKAAPAPAPAPAPVPEARPALPAQTVMNAPPAREATRVELSEGERLQREAEEECEVRGHTWANGRCRTCGKVEPRAQPQPAAAKQSPLIRAKARRLFDRAVKERKMGVEEFQAWVSVVLGATKPSTEWTQEDVDHLEVAFQEPPPAAEPGAAG